MAFVACLREPSTRHLFLDKNHTIAVSYPKIGLDAANCIVQFDIGGAKQLKRPYMSHLKPVRHIRD